MDVGCDLPDGRDASEEPTDGRAQLGLEVVQDDVTDQVVVARRVRPELEHNVSLCHSLTLTHLPFHRLILSLTLAQAHSVTDSVRVILSDWLLLTHSVTDSF